MKPVQYALLFIMAVVGSSVLAAVAYAVQLGIVAKLDEMLGSTSSDAWLATAMFSLFLALPAFALGTAAAGAAVWLIVRQAEFMSARSAAIVGALTTTFVGGCLFAAILGLGGVLLAVPLPGAGAVGGLVFRRVVLSGLATVRPPPAPPA